MQLLTTERHQAIRATLAAEGRVLASSLAERFGVSEDTVRRDLRELARDGACRRVYGGAIAPAPYAGPLGVRTAHLSEEKARLAKAVAKLVKPRQTLFIDGGTTNIAIARAIPLDFELTVATNAIGVASALAEHERIELIVLGGLFNREAGACIGGDALAAISQLGADLLILGSCGVDAARGVTAFDSAEAEVKRAMVKNSGGVVVAATLDKLGTSAPFRVAGPELIQHLVIDREAPTELVAAFAANGTTIHYAG